MPSTLTELLDKTIDAVRSHSSVQKCNEALAHDENQCKGIFLLERLCDLVRFALDSPAKLGASSSRSGELVLNCLRVGLGVAAGSKKDLTHSVLQVAASGARHDKWFVRAAAARVAGEVICESDPSTRLSSILASTDVSLTAIAALFFERSVHVLHCKDVEASVASLNSLRIKCSFLLRKISEFQTLSTCSVFCWIVMPWLYSSFLS